MLKTIIICLIIFTGLSAAAHGADLSIAARPTGGLDVIVRFPPSGAPSTQRRQGVTGRDAASASGAAGPGVDVSLHP